jgi:Serine carboxypeptidase S28
MLHANHRGTLLAVLALVSGIAVGCAGNAAPDAETLDEGLSIGELPIKFTKPIVEASFAQQVDPKDPARGTFQQRYWYTKEFASGPNSPVIFYLCGEWTCSSDRDAAAMPDTLKALGASLVVLEHRYYGQSLPMPHPTLEQMKYLTIENALEDAARFAAWAKTSLGLGGKWIAIGKSYAGTLSALLREQHPETVVGAWASSAPVLFKAFDEGFDRIVAKDFGPTCTRRFRSVLDAADKAFADPAARANLWKRAFGGDFPAPSDRTDYLLEFSGVADSAAQYGSSRPFCNALAQHAGNPVDGFIGYLNPPLVDGPTLDTLRGRQHELSRRRARGDRTASGDAAFPFYAWDYQVCTEFGALQIAADPVASVLPSGVDWKKYGTDYCASVSKTFPDTDAMNKKFFEPLRTGKVTNVLFVNGTEDPWSGLSLMGDMPPGLSSFVIRGGAHRSEWINLMPDSPLGVFEAHKRFHDLAKKWIR